jgi:integrase/recombinase XerD
MATTPLSKKEVKRLLEIVKNDKSHRGYLTIVLGLYTAMRAKEIASLLVKDCYKADGTPRKEFNLDLNRTKSKKSRTVDIGNPVIQKALKTYWVEKKLRKPHQPALEPQRGKSNLTSHGVRTAIKEMLERAGIDNSSHCLRKTCLSTMRKEGYDLELIRSVSGHASLAALQHYLGVTQYEVRDAVRSLKF